MRLEPDVSRRAKLQALWLVARGGVSRVEISACTGISLSALRLLVTRFGVLGLLCLEDARVGNARPRLVADLILPLLEPFNAKSMQRFLLETQGVAVSLSTARRLLIRVARDTG